MSQLLLHDGRNMLVFRPTGTGPGADPAASRARQRPAISFSWVISSKSVGALISSCHQIVAQTGDRRNGARKFKTLRINTACRQSSSCWRSVNSASGRPGKNQFLGIARLRRGELPGFCIQHRHHAFGGVHFGNCDCTYSARKAGSLAFAGFSMLSRGAQTGSADKPPPRRGRTDRPERRSFR